MTVSLAVSATPVSPAVQIRFSSSRFALLVLAGVYPIITSIFYALPPLIDG